MFSYPKIKLFINGQWRERDGDIPIINPCNEQPLGVLPQATRQDLDDAVTAAEKGLRAWRQSSPAHRQRVIESASRIARENRDYIAHAMTLEQGKPILQSRLEIDRGCDILEWDATEGRRTYGRVIPTEPGMRFTVTREPIGVVAAFSPWNFPFSSPARKIGGALAAGCSIILKASEETPAGAMMLVQAFADAGIPDGLINLVYGRPAEISDYLIPHPAVRLVTFTGSVAVGKRLAEIAGRHMKPVIMELGGHAPVIVCADADIKRAAAVSVTGKSRNAGQVCVSPTRFFVEDSVYDRFADEFATGARRVKVGDGLDESNAMGALVNARRLGTIDSMVQDAVAHGANVLAGGSRLGNQGFFYPLTVLGDVPETARAMQEEPFGPLALLSRVQSVDEALIKANSLPYGLAAYAFTESAATVEKISQTIQCGNLAINHLTASFAETPFGGVKDSGYGREGGIEGLDCYMSTKLVSHKMSA
ncbi:NAD-dependent succinate-semialdehyde dehydrogenase [Bradyrhizobium sp.]|uniref:NAD-dependent succinate-semialdehyde dehydrogenase n=1 Tax=Bradyrhizobium sp. TaxID=376 RepID=UPI0039E4D559